MKYKTLEYMKIPIGFQDLKINRSCFIVYSSKEPHIEVVIDSIESIVKDKENFDVKRLGISVKSEDSHYQELLDLLNSCTFAVVILDGFRPNVIFEYGILKGLGKPCIVLLEKEATVDIVNYYLDTAKKYKITNPKIDMDKHFSDVKDRFYLNYDKNNPKGIRTLIQNEYAKIKDAIDKSFIRTIFPNVESVQKELRDCLITLSELASKRKDHLTSQDEMKFKLTIKLIENIINKHNITLDEKYYKTIIDILSDFNQYDDALNLIDILLTKEDTNHDLHQLKSILLTKLDKFEDALKSINTALKIAPQKEYLWHNKGIILEQLKKEEEAILCYKKGIQCNDKCSMLHYHYGILLLERDCLDGAITQFEQALKIHPTNDRYLVLKSTTLQNLGKIDAAKEIAEEALCYNENNEDAWYRLGTLIDDFNKAIEYFDKCLSLNPSHEGALCSKAANLSNIGKYDESLKIFNQMKNICSVYNSCTTIKDNLIKTTYNLSKKSKSKEHELIVTESTGLLLELIDSSENSPTTFNNYGYILMAFDNLESSLLYLNKSINICVDSEDIALPYYNMGILKARLLKYDEALDHFRTCISHCEKSNKALQASCLFIPKLFNNVISFIEIEGDASIDVLETAKQSIETIESYIKSADTYS